MNSFFAFLLVLGYLLFLVKWRSGIYLCIVAGFLQDPIRKLVAGQPVYFQLVAGILFFILILKIVLKGVHLNWSLISGGDQKLKIAWGLFFATVILQSFHTLLHYNSAVLAGLGVFSWVLPMFGIMIGNAFVQNEDNILEFIKFYAWLGVLSGLSVYLSFWLGGKYNVLQDVGLFAGKELIIFHSGSQLFSYSGFLRVGEIAAWHAATASIFLIMMATIRRSTPFKIIAGLLIIALIGAIILTGRRKMLMNLIIFFGMYWLMLSFFWRKAVRISNFIFFVCLVGSLFLWIYSPEGEQAIYVERGASVFDSLPERLATVTDLFKSGINRYGIWGAGAGVISTGSQYFGGGSGLVGGAGEAGMGRIVTELGIVGLVIMLWLLLMIVRFFHRAARHIPGEHYELTVFMAGFSSFLVANIATFFAATQLYGDMFILIILGLATGFLFATERLSRHYVYSTGDDGR